MGMHLLLIIAEQNENYVWFNFCQNQWLIRMNIVDYKNFNSIQLISFPAPPSHSTTTPFITTPFITTPFTTTPFTTTPFTTTSRLTTSLDGFTAEQTLETTPPSVTPSIQFMTTTATMSEEQEKSLGTDFQTTTIVSIIITMFIVTIVIRILIDIVIIVFEISPFSNVALILGKILKMPNVYAFIKMNIK